MARVILENLTKIFPEKHGPGVTAVRDVNLTVEDHEFMVLVGPSGCGKSTTLRMVAGLEDISSGSVSIGGRLVNEVPPKDRDIAMVFQNYALYPHMSVFDNLAFGLRLRRVPQNEIANRVHDAASLLGLIGLLDRRPKALSGGQRQRVALGRAIVRQPEVFLFDEPLSNLDAKMRVSTRAEISKLHARLDATMIYVTHDQVEAMTMGDRICVMQDGNVMQVDEPLNLYHNPHNLFVAMFIGSPPMNRFTGTIEEAGDHLRFTASPAESPGVRFRLPDRLARHAREYIGRPVVLGIRPENFSPATAPVEDRTATAMVERVEPMGAETYLHLRAGPTTFVARVRPELRPETDQPFTVEVDPEKLLLFNAQTEQALR